MSDEPGRRGRDRSSKGEATPDTPSAGRKAEDAGLRRLLEKIHRQHNFDFRQYKEGSIRRRIEPSLYWRKSKLCCRWIFSRSRRRPASSAFLPADGVSGVASPLLDLSLPRRPGSSLI